MKNTLIIGQKGSGKTSLINLIKNEKNIVYEDVNTLSEIEDLIDDSGLLILSSNIPYAELSKKIHESFSLIPTPLKTLVFHSKMNQMFYDDLSVQYLKIISYMKEFHPEILKEFINDNN